jgi:hypothetical protein
MPTGGREMDDKEIVVKVNEIRIIRSLEELKKKEIVKFYFSLGNSQCLAVVTDKKQIAFLYPNATEDKPKIYPGTLSTVEELIKFNIITEEEYEELQGLDSNADWR